MTVENHHQWVSILIILITNRYVSSEDKCKRIIETTSFVYVHVICENTSEPFAPGYFNKELEKIELYHMPMDDLEPQPTLDVFAHLANLTLITFQDSQLTDDYEWELPPNLESYDVSNNEYTVLNVSMCPKIQHVAASNNNLISIPKFAKPTVPLKTLNVENNPLHDFIVDDLIPLCNLTELKIKLPSDSNLLTNKKACECYLLEKWIATFEISGASFECMELKNHVKCDLQFSSLKILRTLCGDEYKIPSPPSVVWRFTLGGLLVLLLIAAGLVVYQFLFRKKSSEKSSSEPVKEQEEEEQEWETEEGTTESTETETETQELETEEGTQVSTETKANDINEENP